MSQHEIPRFISKMIILSEYTNVSTSSKPKISEEEGDFSPWFSSSIEESSTRSSVDLKQTLPQEKSPTLSPGRQWRYIFRDFWSKYPHRDDGFPTPAVSQCDGTEETPLPLTSYPSPMISLPKSLLSALQQEQRQVGYSYCGEYFFSSNQSLQLPSR